MFKYVLFAALLAFASAKPLVYEYPIAYTAPAVAAAYTAPVYSAYSSAYTAPYYSPYAYAAPYSAYYYR
ncbi:cuticle protein 12.5-like [Leguminivora glycinivorella]|uniref:cuticle protein 12.5-like n=1 Tax=Leguminivora glycinivorella TaxID=1035111 RepID=UPI00200D835E|nr:cuticle protein 12.5-like [Leguminivora glycinivorella]